MTIPDEFYITRQGKSYVLFAGLLAEAHQHGLKQIDTELLQVPSDANGHTAICKAKVTLDADSGYAVYSGIGDGSLANVGKAIAAHIIRMAETRAKARALRDAVNIGVAALEEADDGDPDQQADLEQMQGQARNAKQGDRGESGPRAVPDQQPAASGETLSRERGLHLIDLIKSTGHDMDKFTQQFGPIGDLDAATGEHWVSRLEAIKSGQQEQEA